MSSVWTHRVYIYFCKFSLNHNQTNLTMQMKKIHLNLLNCVLTGLKTKTNCKKQLNLNTAPVYSHTTKKVTWKIACTLMCSFSVLLWQLSSVTRGAGFVGASLCGNETAGSIIRSDGKSLCKVFCIITYQSQNSNPQILWVTKHQQLPHYCPPKSSPTNDKERKEEEGERERERETHLPNLSWEIEFSFQ